MSGSDTVNGRGWVTVQDFMPMSFYLTFGFHCDWPRIISLQVLTDNISFIKQNNQTSDCIEYVLLMDTGNCNRFYRQTTLTDLIGGESLDLITEWFDVYKTYN